MTSPAATNAASAWVDRHEAETGCRLARPLSHIKAFLDGVAWSRQVLETHIFVIHLEDGTEERVVSLADADKILADYVASKEIAEARAQADRDAKAMREWRPQEYKAVEPPEKYGWTEKVVTVRGTTDN
jgi:hypothetical protein